ncbi:acetyl-CoA hydrolase/transferase family protein [Aminipila sp.]|uniref:acetyl-CoA hydrolase/transferase family protein n=2 Tax=Aminipila sp. TaxID=2060095 RepID=UPI00289CF521|nr:acetyl-CoA hydrolase/transferase C-terminal domain-containing protein [Aminipila sp.]
MDFRNEYKNKLRTPEEAVEVVKSGDWIDVSVSLGFPSLLDSALAKRKEELTEVKVRGYLVLQPIQMIEQDPERKHFIYNSWHCSGYERKLCDRGLCNYIPMIYRNVAEYYRRYLTVNVAMMAVTPMDNHGYFNFSVNNATARATMDAADVIILEVNENLPRVFGGREEMIHISEVDFIVEGTHEPLPTLSAPPVTENDHKIAKYIVEKMVDGSTVQLGIGGMPNAVGKMIADSDLKELGMHTELMVDAYLDMYKKGKLTNRKKNIDADKGIFGFALGSQELYDWARENPGLVTYPINYTNAPEIIGQLDNFVSINNCIAVDLYGQICSESAGTRHISGTGGQLDFLTGAFMSKGGKAFICMTSSFTDKDGQIKSRFYPTFSKGDIVTNPRSQGFYLVTEYGMINLAGRSTWEKAEMIISLAHPEHREQLIQAAEKQKIWIKSNKR